ncbi:GlmU family protein [Chryseobacterium indoltheticum]|uniref:UDP-N-acetylglucosamine diphosphorylase/glucosamine-1-phosphate N-acetyltransferase n=1 Tax=Chryseobacterium indoltheticum TaxID=254 RepID=A0A381JSA8_9FLAO|nr:GlmU family protein [Chryseobacterium indoltheticum]AZA75776.1 glucose-1-phosphate thymidylyltransferase [Chryseobacterium indoltheticum]SIQ50600.1 UDP-N-acetylglucosamine diphosphorylase/glucosamine-1-phosphate N-acetyltransferase [Chryseobacterium indoltheticum]SUY53915.1 UDP-N-acetylglucosamine diphosphorylase/glucosamine-1-phosphate N-acetyltransferase [Chryseobacterium indoltheticum]
MQLVFSDAQYWEDFLPLTFTRPIAEMRCGILTFSERWQKILATTEVSWFTEMYLQQKFREPEKKESLFLVPNFLPTETVIQQIKELKQGEALVYEDELVAAKINMEGFSLHQIEKMTDIKEELVFYKKPTDLFTYNKEAIDFDFELLTKGKISQELSSTNGFLGNKEDLFIEEGAEIEFSTINTKTGKIYIGKNAEVMEGCNLRGPIALCEGSKFNLGAKIYGATTIGPHSKVGGEVSNIIIFGYSNKGHDGFVGNSVIGEWCNLGADTNSSNLKNNYGNVKLWNYRTKDFQDTGLQFAGLIMGDHSKTAINTQLNTGTVIGVASNIFKEGFPPNLIENFSWGGFKDDERFKLDKAYEVAEKVMARRKLPLTDGDKAILKHIFNEY